MSKPSVVRKNATSVFSIDKSELVLHPKVVASAHFSNTEAWDKVIIKYKSLTLGQFESIEFDATLASPEGQFFVSETAEDIFEVEKITIIDKDGAILLIPRAELTVAEFDIDFAAVANPIDYITWDLLSGYQAGSLVISPSSGVSGGSSLSGMDVAVKSDIDKATGDFDYTFKFDWSAATSVVHMFIGVTGNSTTTGTSFFQNLTCIYGNGDNPDTAHFWHNGSSVGNTQTLINGENIYRVKRVGSTITQYLNSVEVYSSISTIFTAYPSVRTVGNSIATESYITEAPAVQAVTWNVAGKSGVGTVTTGANGLITKSAGGGAGYNVNVLSNEAITGDGYVEFIWSHTNVVFGLAETIHPSGSYTNIIYGGYYTASYIGWELFPSSNTTNSTSYGVSGFLNVGDVIKLERVGNLYKTFINGSLWHTGNMNNLNPLKASICIYSETNGVNGATISL
jgi:hypothetical protein